MLFRSNKDQVKYFLQFLIVFYLDIFKVKNNQRVSLISLIDRYNELKEIDNSLLQEKLEKTQDLLEKINYNINIDMAFSKLILQIS